MVEADGGVTDISNTFLEIQGSSSRIENRKDIPSRFFYFLLFIIYY